MALEVADKRIRINGIAPGAIATMMNIDVLEDEKKLKEEEEKIRMHYEFRSRMGLAVNLGDYGWTRCHNKLHVISIYHICG